VTVVIRPAIPGDHAVLLAIWEQSVRATHAFLTEADIASLHPLVAEELASGSLELWVLTEADAACGWMGLAGAKIEALFLAPEARGQGGGRQLIEHAQALRGGALTVDVNEQNPDARGFYERLGFVVTGRSELDGGGRPFPLLHLRRPAPGPGDASVPRQPTLREDS
jgi:putative acetyltransferase